jgi:hypothetical protein
MADSTTTNLLLTKPEVGASTDTWGSKINTDLDSVDAVFAAAGTGTSVGLNVGSGKTLKVAGTTDFSANLTFTGTGNRITGDFSNATIANRVAFQSSTTNGPTAISVIPNGTNNSTIISFSNASDPDNAAFNYVGTVSSEFRITGTKYGTGSYQPVVIQTGGSESLRLSATTKAVILAGGSTSANGTGITFPATQSASSDVNTLDDYEEGTWTPVLRGSGTAGNFNQATSTGKYTKIGNMVTLYCAISGGSVTGSPTGDLQITGLPFACAAGTSAAGATQTQYLGITQVPTVSFSTRGTSSILYLAYVNGSQVAALVQASAVGSSAIVDFCISYPT